MEIKEIMNVKEVAEYIGLSITSIYRLVKEKKLPAIRISGSLRFKKSVIDEMFS